VPIVHPLATGQARRWTGGVRIERIGPRNPLRKIGVPRGGCAARRPRVVRLGMACQYRAISSGALPGPPHRTPGRTSGDVPVKQGEAARRPPHTASITLTDDPPSITEQRFSRRVDRGDVDAVIADLVAWRESRRRIRTPHNWPAEPCSGMCACWGTPGGWWNGREVWSWFVAEGRWSA
jgi:hypothetical protein